MPNLGTGGGKMVKWGGRGVATRHTEPQGRGGRALNINRPAGGKLKQIIYFKID